MTMIECLNSFNNSTRQYILDNVYIGDKHYNHTLFKRKNDSGIFFLEAL